MRAVLRVCLCLLPGVLRAQPAGVSFDAVVDRQRWLYPAQRESTTRWLFREGWSVRIDSTESQATSASSRARAGQRVLLNVGRDESATVTIDARGGIGDFRFRSRPVDPQITRDSVLIAEWEVTAIDQLIRSLPLLLRSPERVGQVRQTPLSVKAVSSLNDRQVFGSFTTTRLSDTLVDGVLLHRLRDVGSISLTMRSSFNEHAGNGVRRETRALRGRWVVRRLYDARRMITVSLDDSLQLMGRETDTLPDRRVISAPVRFQEYRRVVATDSATSWAREWSDYLALERSSIVSVGADSAVRLANVLIASFRSATKQATRDSLEDRIKGIYPHIPDSRLAEIYLEEGDTARAARTIRSDGSLPFDARAYDILRPFLDDPQRALRHGIDIDDYLEALVYGFTNSPPAVARDSLQTFCVPSLCARVAAEWTKARDPRLRDIGLLAAAASDPFRWGDTLIERARTNHPMLRGVARQLTNARHLGDALPDLAFPGVTADWRAWLLWFRLGRYGPIRRNPNDIREWIDRVDSRSLQMAMRYRGHAYRDTIAARFARAEVDTARYVYGTVLQALGMHRDEATLARVIESGTPLDVELAATEAWDLPFVAADTSTASLLELQMIERYTGQPPAWRLAGLPMRFSDWTDGIRIQRYQTWSGNVQRGTSARLVALGLKPWTSNMPESVARSFVFVDSVRRVGSFATVGVQFPQHGARYLLVLVHGEWKLLAVRSSVV